MRTLRQAFLAVFGSAALCASVFAASGTATYIYDSAGRVRGAVYEDGSAQTYQYDPAGNRQQTSTAALSGVSIVSTASVTEGSTASLGVTRIGTTGNAITLTVAAQNGTAVAGTNYTAPSSSWTLAAGQTSGNISVATIRDSKYAGPLDFTVTIASASSAVVISQSKATVTVANNDSLDPPPSFAISGPATLNEGSTATYTVTKTNATALTHVVSYATAAGTAVSGTDYSPTSGQLSFAPANTSKTFTVPTVHTAGFQLSRTYSAVLSAPAAGATLGTASVTTTISDLDAAPVFTIANSTPASVVEGGTLSFTVSKANPTNQTHSVSFTRVNGTAGNGDYTVATASPLVFSPNETSRTIIVNTLSDASDEGATPETFSISLSSATNGGTIGSPSSGTGQIREGQREPPGAPVLTPEYQEVASGESFTVQWTVPPGYITSYELYKQKDGASSQTLMYSGTATTYSGSIGPAGTYAVRVRACNASGCGAYSADVEVVRGPGG